jgi:hypothetical protein
MNGDLCTLELQATDPTGARAVTTYGGRSMAERYRLISERTTAGERILVYVGEPPER